MTTTRGQHLIGKEVGSCVMERLLGYGGSSAVFLAHSLTSEEQVAVKVFLPRSTLDGHMRKSFYRRFLREAEAASKLDHPNILSIFAYGEHEGMPYIVMPYMPGGTLAEHVQTHGPLSLAEAQIYLQQIAKALDYAHAHGCVHCDVKPANILLDGAGGAALSDFGIVRLLQTDDETEVVNKSSEKSSEILMGTPDYISPEQALGEALDGRSDIYSLGATLYYLLTAEPPFKSESLIALALMHVHETPTPLGLMRADITQQIDLVLSKALAKWPEERFQTTEAFYKAFAEAVQAASETQQNQLPASEHGEKRQTLPEAHPLVRITAIKSTRSGFHLWRVALTLGLIAVLLLGFLLIALFIGNITGPHPHSQVPRLTPTGVPTQHDDLSDQADWPTSSTFFFQGNAYHIQNKSPVDLATAFYSNFQFTNFHLTITLTETTGSLNSADYYGVLFRASTDQSHYYLFEITAGNQGQYGFLRYDGSSHWTRLAQGQISNFHIARGQSNSLDIQATGETFTFSINNRQIGKPIRDASSSATLLTSGEIGLVVEEQQTEVVFSKLFITEM